MVMVMVKVMVKVMVMVMVMVMGTSYSLQGLLQTIHCGKSFKIISF